MSWRFSDHTKHASLESDNIAAWLDVFQLVAIPLECCTCGTLTVGPMCRAVKCISIRHEFVLHGFCPSNLGLSTTWHISAFSESCLLESRVAYIRMHAYQQFFVPADARSGWSRTISLRLVLIGCLIGDMSTPNAEHLLATSEFCALKFALAAFGFHQCKVICSFVALHSSQSLSVCTWSLLTRINTAAAKRCNREFFTLSKEFYTDERYHAGFKCHSPGSINNSAQLCDCGYTSTRIESPTPGNIHVHAKSRLLGHFLAGSG